MKSYVPPTSARRLGFATAAIGFVILSVIVRSLDAGVVLAALVAAALFGALISSYSRAWRPVTRRMRRSPAVAVPRPAREIAVAAAAAARA